MIKLSNIITQNSCEYLYSYFKKKKIIRENIKLRMKNNFFFLILKTTLTSLANCFYGGVFKTGDKFIKSFIILINAGIDLIIP